MFIGSCPRKGSLVSWRHHTPPQAAGRLLCSRPSRQGCPGQHVYEHAREFVEASIKPGTLGISGIGR